MTYTVFPPLVILDRLPCEPAQRPIDRIILHESVTSSRASTVRVLAGKGLGVHFIVDRDGSITQHVPLDYVTYHADGASVPAGAKSNLRSIAIEAVNRYYPPSSGVLLPGEGQVINAVWAHKGRYLVPTIEQCEAIWNVIQFINESTGFVLSFPFAGPGEFFWGARAISKSTVGVWAHHRSAHADGLFHEHYCSLRHAGTAMSVAYIATLNAAAAGARKTPWTPSLDTCDMV